MTETAKKPDVLPTATWPHVYRYILQQFAHHRNEFLGGTLLTIASVGAAGTIPWLLGRITDSLVSGANESVSVPYEYVWWIVAAGVIAAVLAWCGDVVTARAAERVSANIRDEYVTRCMNLPLSVVERVGTGVLTARSITDIGRVNAAARGAFPVLLQVSPTLLVTIVVSLFVTGWLALTWILVVGMCAMPVRQYLSRCTRAFLAEGKTDDQVISSVAESVEYARTIDALDCGQPRRRQLNNRLRRSFLAQRYTLALRNSLVVPVTAAIGMSLGVALIFAPWLVHLHMATVGQVVALGLYLLRAQAPLLSLAFWLDEVQLFFTSVSRILGVSLVHNDRATTNQLPSHSRIEVHNVSFHYHPGLPVLSSVNLVVEPGEYIAVVGPSGAGKSTLGRLLAGAQPPTCGMVKLGEVPMTELSTTVLRREVVLLTQEAHVFIGSVADNVRLASPDIDDDTARQALEKVGANWVRELRHGIHTVIGAGHLELDPSAAQQVALARVVVLNPHTVILDEATSLLAPSEASGVETQMHKVLAGRTIIAIAHQLRVAQNADRVCYLENGSIKELGHHEDLLAADEGYAKLWCTWLSGQQEPDE